jgi:amino acid adenylation domain-containing protein
MTYLLHQLLEQAAQRHPERPAVVDGKRTIDYGELHRRSDRLAAALVRDGMKQGDRVALLLDKSIEALVALFAVLKGGGIYVPIDSQAPAQRMRHIVEHCGIRCAFASASALATSGDELEVVKRVILVGADEAEKRSENRILSMDALMKSEPVDFTPATPSDVHPAYILHTSGSTGIPKGVVISHRNALAFVEMAAEFFTIVPEDRMAAHAPLHFDLSVFDLFVAMRAGACVVLVPEKLGVFPMNISRFISEEKISVWNSVASLLSLLAERGKLERFDFADLRLVLFSGEPVPLKHLRAVMESFPRAEFYNIYGQTEANSSTWFKVKKIPENAGKTLPIGKPFPNFDVFAIREDGTLLTAPGESGELYVSSSTVAQGYWGDAERSAERFVRDPREHMRHAVAYRTGDLVTLDGEGNLVFLGRADHQVKCRGYRVNLGEVDHVLAQHPSVRESLTLAIPDDIFGNRLLSFACLVEGSRASPEEIIEYCGRTLPAYMLPESIAILESFPRTATGKIDRQQLKGGIQGSRSQIQDAKQPAAGEN